ncbi:MAG TPA: hypothetical protein PK733_11430 [Clostridiales bacterium]|nr:hypothetical protein [Clostridiales bacterium]
MSRMDGIKRINRMNRKISIALTALIFFSLFMSVVHADKTTPYITGIIEGYFIKYEEGKVWVEEYDGTLHSIPLIRNPSLLIDGRNVSITDFKYGMEIYGDIKDKMISNMNAFSVDLPGYILPGGKVRTGLVREIRRDKIKIKLPSGKEETYLISPATVTLKNGEYMSLSTLYEGDMVKLYFDDIKTTLISRIEIEGNSIIIKDIYKATLIIADEWEDAIVLGNVEVFRNGKWESVSNSLKLPYNTDFPLYVGSVKVPYKNMKYYKGKTVYMIIKDFFGKDRIERIIVKNQYESAFSDKIEKINWYASQIELANYKNISFYEGTIVIKSGRLSDIYALTPKTDGLIIADSSGDFATADIICVYNEDINNSNIGQDCIYAGRLDTILEDKLYIKDFSLLSKNDWAYHGYEKELYYYSDTFIYDLENKKQISSKEFLAGNYAVDEDNLQYRNLKDWYGYIYTDEDRITSIYVKKTMDYLSQQRITAGIIETRPEHNQLMGWTVKLADAKDWSSRHRLWMPKNASLNLYIRETMIMKNSVRVEPEDLKEGDRLYIVRDDANCKVVIVK